MTIPIVQRTWAILPNQRVSTTTGLTGTTQGILYGQKNFLTASGYTLKGTGANGTGAMDQVDRWTSPSVIIAGTAAGAAQNGVNPAFNTGILGDCAWAVLTDGNGGDIMLSWIGVTADIYRVSYSPGSLFVLSSYHISGGCPPTASDEAHIINSQTANTVVGTKASADRVWNGWASSDKKACRFIVAQGGNWVGTRWGIETVTSTTVGTTCVWSGSWGFADLAVISTDTEEFATYNDTGNYHGGLASMSIGGIRKIVQLVKGTEMYNLVLTTWGNIKTDAQSNSGYPIFPIGIGGLTTAGGGTGKFGNLVDQWIGRTGLSTALGGDTYGSLQFIVVSTRAGIMWPWDGLTNPVMQ